MQPVVNRRQIPSDRILTDRLGQPFAVGIHSGTYTIPVKRVTRQPDGQVVIRPPACRDPDIISQDKGLAIDIVRDEIEVAIVVQISIDGPIRNRRRREARTG